MTTPYARRASYRRSFERVGEPVTLRRRSATPHAEAGGVLARLRGFDAEPLAPGFDRGGRRVLLLAEDVERSGFPMPLRKDDEIVTEGGAEILTVVEIDDRTRCVAGVLLAYEILATGLA